MVRGIVLQEALRVFRVGLVVAELNLAGESTSRFHPRPDSVITGLATLDNLSLNTIVRST